VHTATASVTHAPGTGASRFAARTAMCQRPSVVARTTKTGPAPLFRQMAGF